jgi:hypothetical protein
MSDELTHVAVGDAIAKVVDLIPDDRISTPFVAAVLAFASHAAMDVYDNDYTLDPSGWSRDAYKLEHEQPILANQISGIGMDIYSILTDKDQSRRDKRLAAFLGSIAPDIIEGVYIWLHPEKWQTGELLLPWHQSGVSKGSMQTLDFARKRTGVLAILQYSLAIDLGSIFKRKKKV